MNAPEGTMTIEWECLGAFKLSAYYPEDAPDFAEFISAFRKGPWWEFPKDDPRYLVVLEQWLKGRGCVVSISITCRGFAYPLVWLDLWLARWFYRHVSLAEYRKERP